MRDELAALIAQVNIPSLAEALDGSDPLATRCAIALVMDAPAMFAPCHPRDEVTQRIERAQLELSDALAGLTARLPPSELAPLRAAIERLSHVPLAPLGQRVAQMIKSLATELGKTCEAMIDLGEIVVLPAT